MNKKTRKRFFSSRDQSWATPQDFFNRLDNVFNFCLDPCATDKNAKCPKYYTKYEDGLKQDWSKWGGAVFVNPPFSRELPLWVEKCYNESLKGITVVMLIPARTDTRYYHNYCFKATILFIKGRLKFVDPKNIQCKTSAFFPSALIVFGNIKDYDLNELNDLGCWMFKRYRRIK